MRRHKKFLLWTFLLALGCSSQPQPPAATEQSRAPAPPPASVGGFDATRAFDHLRHLVELGPRPSGSDAIHAAQSYISTQLKGSGCQVEEHDFQGATPIGDFAMKNIVAKAPGTNPGIILYATHYDTVRIPNFVGADDGGSGTATLLELARNICARKNSANVWFAFFDGEEAQGNWNDSRTVQWIDSTNNTYGSREMAATMALSGDLKRIKAMILADMIGPPNLKIKRETNSTPWLNDLIWATAARLGYSNVFVDESFTVSGDDHLSFIRRGVPGTDIIDFDIQTTYWHTREDTLEKIDPRSLATVGYVFLAVLPELEKQ
ncbi:MAG TPA: M28 family peptidase [Candidatus Acidoferrum sp.]|nr:M28 family peptidase [Candidatus Acidoferrum sp.]